MHDDRGAVERLQDRLYSKTAQTGVRPRSVPQTPPAEKPHGWQEENTEPTTLTPKLPQKPRSSGALLPFFFGALLFFLGAVGFAIYSFLYGGNTVSSSNINLTVLGPSMIDGGKDASFDITVENRNVSALELVDLLVEYPEGTRSASDTKVALPHERISIGDIPSGGRIKQTVHAVLFGEEGSTQHIKASIEYRVAGSNAIFVKEAGLDVMIGASPVAIVVDGPDEATAGQPFQFTVHVRSNAQAPVKNLTVEAQYPFGFSITNVSPETSAGDGLWHLGDLNPGEEKTVKIEGTLDGQNDEDRVFRFLAGSENDQTAAHVSVPYLIVPHQVAIKRPFISSDLTINGSSGQNVVVSPGQQVRATVTWKNNLDTNVQDVEIQAKVTGQALDKSSVIVSRGFYRSADSSVVWNKDGDSALGDVPPGGSGSEEFTFTAVASDNQTVLVNPQIEIAVSVAGRRIQQGDVPETITSAYSRTVRVGSALSAVAKSHHFTGALTNTGPMPPKVDQETTYTITWTIKNPSNTISNGKASATLPSYVRYIGAVSPANERVTYDSRSNTVSWALGDIKAGAGYSLSAREVSFQVGLTPSITQVSQTPQLTSDMTITGDDRFTGAKLQAKALAPSTRVEPESGFTTGMENVQK